MVQTKIFSTYIYTERKVFSICDYNLREKRITRSSFI